MKSYWSTVGPKSHDSVLTRVCKGHREAEERSWGHRGRDETYAATNQGAPGATKNLGKSSSLEPSEGV